MTLDLPALAAPLGQAMLAALNTDSARLKALALAEGEALTHALARISMLAASGEVDGDEAKILLRIQRDASEAVLSSLAEVSRLSAERAVAAALREALGRVLGKGPLEPILRAIVD
jgi:hypothetical protein